MKKYVFLFSSHFNNFFCYSRSYSSHIKFVRPIFFRTVTQPKPSAFQNIPSIFRNKYGNSFYSIAKLRKPIPLQSKRPKFCRFQGLKAVGPQFFLEILKAQCLSFHWVSKLIQISFQALEQNNVNADACKASD